MTPHISSSAMPAHSVKLTVAKRKEASELRKTLKPLMEKRRRARINESLIQLKTLILPLIGKDNSRYSKLEKADILEMTVRFLRDLPSTPVQSPSDGYREGYKACLHRVSSLLPKTDLLDKDTCQRLNEYIQRSIEAAAPAGPACLNCSGPNSRAFPRRDQSVLRLNPTGGSRPESNSNGPLLDRRQPVPQAPSANMWRPW
uniref:Hes family bHLH transcription factor 2, tandem duplicate 2 n=1 Tax=Lepisosteus oculatus TaxID=7918 RepID=W5MCL3_LEPOC|nr:PREDICTED: transcription factor HES-2 [Lepisosteus oculatus]